MDTKITNCSTFSATNGTTAAEADADAIQDTTCNGDDSSTSESIPNSLINAYIQKYQLDQRYPFTEKQIIFLLRLLQRYLYSSNINSNINSNSNSNSNSNNNQNNNHVQGHQESLAISKIVSEKISEQAQAQALEWIDAHLITPYYSTFFLYDLLQSAIQHSHVFLNTTSNPTSDNTKKNDSGSGGDTDAGFDDDAAGSDARVNSDDDILNEATIHLFLEVMGGLSGRKGGPAFEIKVLYEFILKRNNNNQCCGAGAGTTTNTTERPHLFKVKHNHNDHDIDEMNGDGGDGDGDGGNDGMMMPSLSIVESKGTFDQDETVDIEEMISLLYRLALACHVLQHWPTSSSSTTTTTTTATSTKLASKSTMDKDDNGNSHGNGYNSGNVIPNHHNDGGHQQQDQHGRALLSQSDLNHIAYLGQSPPRNMVDSLGLYSHQNISSSATTIAGGGGGGLGFGYDDTNNNISAEVNYDTFRNWVEINFPQMACILSSFIHFVFFSLHEDDNEAENKDKNHNSENVTNDINNSDSDDDSDGDEEKIAQLNLLSSYAQGKRTMFEFPKLQQLITSKTFVKGSITQRIIGTLPVSSILFSESNSNSNSTTTHSTTSTTTSTNDRGDQSSVMSEGVVGHFAFGMACMDSNLSGKWNRLYSTEADGFAFLNMQRALTGYTGPTVMIVRPTKASSLSSSSSPGLLGCYTANPWRESNNFFGTSECFLFRAEPMWNVYRPRYFVQGWKIDHYNHEGSTVDSSLSPSPLRKKKMKENYMYFHPSAGHVNAGFSASSSNTRYGSATKPVKPSGIVMGGTIDQPRFHITESFEQCVASSGNMMDMTFESGPLLPGQWDKYYNIDVLEVWGVGGDDVVRQATSAKDKHEDMANAVRRKVQRVDKSQFLDDFKSGLHIGSNLFQHRLDGNIRHDFGVDINNNERCE